MNRTNNIQGAITDIYVDDESEIIFSIRINNDNRPKTDIKVDDPELSIFGFENIKGIFIKNCDYPKPGMLDPDQGKLGSNGIAYYLAHFNIEKEYIKRIEKLRTADIQILLQFKLTCIASDEITAQNMIMVREGPTKEEYNIECEYKLKEGKWIEVIGKLGYHGNLINKKIINNILTLIIEYKIIAVVIIIFIILVITSIVFGFDAAISFLKSLS